ncbi:hypothetical protein O0I10_004971 [Lichtheimia ornata]|uniref:Cyclin-domain-containing protein n=1 Tax=Lichtheimia ornata TaxID=688661 RepID=A0AAD7Y1U9_9FUNG|nr:uncharacterized protein O0I10_004971 [Lichtheimia ornata]KAJ8659257.1 hypothetical protein O0I10_004971 [Lichtheimia ornata]
MPFTFLPLPCRHEKPDLSSYTSSSSFNKPLASSTSSSSFSLHLPNNNNNNNNNISSQYGPWCCAPSHPFSFTSLPGKDQQPVALSTTAVDDPEMYALQTMFAALETRTNHSEHVAMSVAKQRQQQQTAGTHPAYVEALVDTTAHIIETIWPSSSSTSAFSPAKHATTLPCSPPSSPTASMPTTPAPAVVSLRTFIQEVLKRSRTTYSTLQTALFYLFRARPAILSQLYYTSSPGVVTPPSPPPAASENAAAVAMEMGGSYFAWQDAYIHCGRRMFLAALVTASKFVQDKTYRNSTWAKIAGLPVAEINAAERIFLNLISYRLYIAQPTFERWHHLLHMHVEARAATTNTSSTHPTTTTTTWLHYNHQHHASTNTTTTTTTKNRKRRSTLSSTTTSSHQQDSSKKRKVATITETSGRSYAATAANNKKSKRQ